VSRPDIEACAVWLQRHLGAYLFTVDHPGLPHCAGAHRPGQPCDGSRGKHPCGRWSRDSTNDPSEILGALARGLRNLGIDCGKSGYLVVDEDSPGAFEAYTGSVGEPIPATFTVTTSKGRHIYFRQPPGEPLGNGRGALAGRGIDIRGRGGFTVGPGSIHETGVVYAPVDSTILMAPAPGWLVTALRSAAPGAAAPAGAGVRPGSVYGRLRGAVVAVLDAKPGERNNVLYWAACRAAEVVADGQVDQATAVDVLTQAGETAGLGAGEVQATIASAFRGVMA
jgi:hypothetical protein